MIIAGWVGVSNSGENLLLRHTTIMPNIQGFPMIMTLLFCPTMDPKPTEDGTSFTAILCGLNLETKFRPSCTHDIVVNLDTELSQEILKEVGDHSVNISIFKVCLLHLFIYKIFNNKFKLNLRNI